MNKKSFLDLLDRYQHDQCTETEKIFIEQWYASLNDEDHVILTSTEVSKMSSSILSKLYANMEGQVKIPKQNSIKWYKTAIAASIAIAIASACIYAYDYNNTELSFKRAHAQSKLIYSSNNADTALTIVLSDRSLVTLQPRAQVIYPEVFNGNCRQVYLKGDAFFKVTKNLKKPFYVFNNHLKVSVLGTSFFVKELGSQVSVRTGRVEVNENSNRKLFPFMKDKPVKGILLTPNQKAVFDDKHHEIQRMLIDQPLPLANANEQPEFVSFKFSETSLKDVFEKLSKVYGITIKLQNAAVNDCTFTGDVDNKGLYEQLNLICESISGSYRVEGTNILVTAKSCN